MRKLLALTLTALLAAFAVIGAAASAPTPAASGATLSTDKTDYQPGETVIFTGSGFNPYEQVDIVLREDPARHPDTTLTSTADERGAIINKDYKPTEENVGTSYTATATGRESGRTAVVRFTDGGNFSYSPNPLSAINVQSLPTSQTLTRTLAVIAPNPNNGPFTADVTVTRPGGMPASILTTLSSANFLPSTNRLSYGPNSSNQSRSVNVNVMIPAGAAAGSYTINVRATQNTPVAPPNQVGPGQGSDLTITITNDPTDPDTTASATTGGSDPYTFGTWTNKNVKVTLAATDTGTGVNQTFYSIDGGAYSLYPNGGINFNDEGVFVLMFYSTDFAGNAEDPDSAVIKIDKTKPVIDAQRDTPANAHGWNNTAVLSSYTASDALSGLPAGANTGSFTFASEGANQSHTFAVTDLAGNFADATVSGVNIDMTAPDVTAQRDTTANGNGWNNGPVQVSYTATDALSGIDAAASDASPFTLTGDGANRSHAFTAYDLAGNPDTDTVSGINIDTGAPVISAGATKADDSPYAAGTWTNQSVTVTFQCSDGGSGVASVDPPVTVSSEGAGQSASGSCSDLAGNSAQTTFQPIDIDKTAPTILASLARPPDHNGWYNADVVASATASDNAGGSGIDAANSSYDPYTFSVEGANLSHTFTVADFAGNSASDSVTGVKLDKTKPTLTFDPQSPAANGAGWNNTNVSFAYDASDGLSGVDTASPASPLVLTSEGSAVSGTVTVTDVAGNSETFTSPWVKIDKTAPSVNCGGPDGLWHNANVGIVCTAGDTLSGVSGSDTVTLVTSVNDGFEDSNAATDSHTFTDAAGNTAAAGPIAGNKVDRKKPSVSCGSADNAWHPNDVSIGCTSGDGGSGLANASDASFSLSTGVPANTETSNASTGTRQVCDAVANCDTAGPVGGNMVDKKAPVINITVPAGNTYLLNQAVASAYTVTDGGSGVASSTPASGAALNTSTVGPKTFAVAAADNVGNQSNASAGYTVGYGFVALYDQAKSVKRGATIPIKIRLVDFNGANVSSPSVVVSAIRLVHLGGGASDAIIADQNHANGDGNFRYDASLGGYIFNLSTKNMGLIDGSWRLDFAPSGDPTAHSVYFGVVR